MQESGFHLSELYGGEEHAEFNAVKIVGNGGQQD